MATVSFLTDCQRDFLLVVGRKVAIMFDDHRFARAEIFGDAPS